MDLKYAYQLILVILSIGLVVISLEDLRSWPVFAGNGLLSWKIGRFSFWWSKRLDWLLNDKVFRGILYIKLAGAFCLLGLAIFGTFSPILLGILLFCHAAIVLRSAYGLDGAYQMNTMILLAMSIGGFAGVGSKISKICLWFIAGELILSYVVAGLAKLISPVWREAYALPLIFGTRSYGHYGVYQWISKRNSLSLFLCWTVFLLETFFFVVLLLPLPYALVLCSIGCSFHLFNALFMGLNDFLFSFLAAYPALIYCIMVLN